MDVNYFFQPYLDLGALLSYHVFHYLREGDYQSLKYLGLTRMPRRRNKDVWSWDFYDSPGNTLSVKDLRIKSII